MRSAMIVTDTNAGVLCDMSYPTPERWQDRAACRGVDPDVFFPDVYVGCSAAPYAQALAFCRSCPVTAECLAFASANNLRDGVFGGKTPAQRSKMRRPVTHYERECECGTEFSTTDPRRRYCGPVCSHRAAQARWRMQNRVTYARKKAER